MNEELAALAAANGGLFTNSQARECGYTKKAIRCRLRSTRWVALERGIYVEARVLGATRADPAWRHALMVGASLLALEKRAAGSHHSAARVHGLELLRAPEAVSLVRHRRDGAPKTPPHSARMRAALLPPEHVCYRYGVAVTTAARTVVDLARTLPFREGVVVADSALRGSHVRVADLLAILAYSHGWPGSRRAAEVVAFADALAESVLESLARAMFAEYGLPAPQTQVTLGDDRGAIGRVDFYWAEYGVAGEADGLMKYDSRYALLAEKHRQERLENEGFLVVRFTWDDVVRHPERTVERILQAFARATRRVSHKQTAA